MNSIDKSKAVASGHGFIVFWLAVFLAAERVQDIRLGRGDRLGNNIEDDTQDDRGSPNVHPVLELQFFPLDVLPTPDIGIEHADQSQDAFQSALLLEEPDKHHNATIQSDGWCARRDRGQNCWTIG